MADIIMSAFVGYGIANREDEPFVKTVSGNILQETLAENLSYQQEKRLADRYNDILRLLKFAEVRVDKLRAEHQAKADEAYERYAKEYRRRSMVLCDFDEVMQFLYCCNIEDYASDDLENMLRKDLTLYEFPSWTRVEDGLPKKRGQYLVTYHPCHWDSVDESKTLVGVDSFRGGNKSLWARNKYQKVIAWKPLPEPMKVGGRQ